MQETAIEAAKKGGEVLARYFEQVGLERMTKDDQSFVTKADQEAEAAIVAVLSAAFPEHGIVGEEGTHINEQAEYQWILDPLDGTGNFINGIPLFCVSIACVVNDTPVVGVIHNPITNSLYVAERGKGATYNGHQISVSSQQALQGLVSYGSNRSTRDQLYTLFCEGKNRYKSQRILGSTALELCYLARGGTEGFFCLGLKKWDYAAGVLIALEAGATVTTLTGEAWNMSESFFIASNGELHPQMLEAAKTI